MIAPRRRRQRTGVWPVHSLTCICVVTRSKYLLVGEPAPRWIYGQALYEDPAATLDDFREAVATLEDSERIARRVLGNAHPTTTAIEDNLQKARAKLFAQSNT